MWTFLPQTFQRLLQWTQFSPLDNAIIFPNTYPVDSDSGNSGKRTEGRQLGSYHIERVGCGFFGSCVTFPRYTVQCRLTGTLFKESPLIPDGAKLNT